jgi:ribosome-binding protein aMBF1 (putative translation factor)
MFLREYIMRKKASRTYSQYTEEAVRVLGMQIKAGRLEKGWPETELAERAGVSRTFVRAVEAGKLQSEVGSAFEMAYLVGVPLFDPPSDRPDTVRMKTLSVQSSRLLGALSKRAVKSRLEVDDDF